MWSGTRGDQQSQRSSYISARHLLSSRCSSTGQTPAKCHGLDAAAHLNSRSGWRSRTNTHLFWFWGQIFGFARVAHTDVWSLARQKGCLTAVGLNPGFVWVENKQLWTNKPEKSQKRSSILHREIFRLTIRLTNHPVASNCALDLLLRYVWSSRATKLGKVSVPTLLLKRSQSVESMSKVCHEMLLSLGSVAFPANASQTRIQWIGTKALCCSVLYIYLKRRLITCRHVVMYRRASPAVTGLLFRQWRVTCWNI